MKKIILLLVIILSITIIGTSFYFILSNKKTSEKVNKTEVKNMILYILFYL